MFEILSSTHFYHTFLTLSGSPQFFSLVQIAKTSIAVQIKPDTITTEHEQTSIMHVTTYD